MLANLETLLELYKQGTMAKASSVLRVSQSAVSKRISALENYCGTRLLEKVGRNVALTEEAHNLIERAIPLLAALRETLSEGKNQARKKVILGVSESILSSWGAAKLELVFKKLNLEVEYHSHRSPLVIERVEAGIYDVGLCSGKVANPRSILSEELKPEELVLVASTSEGFRGRKPLNILCIEPSSATWKAVKGEVVQRNLRPQIEMESFFSIGQLAKAGHGIGLVPIGVARALGFRKECMNGLKPKIFRPIQVVYKKSKLERPYFRELINELRNTLG